MYLYIYKETEFKKKWKYRSKFWLKECSPITEKDCEELWLQTIRKENYVNKYF